MNETKFNNLIDETLTKIEEVIDESGEDIDIELTQGILTLTFENGSKIIINRQAPLNQLWLAAKHDGYHFNRVDDRWVCDKTNATLAETLQQNILKQAHLSLIFNL